MSGVNTFILGEARYRVTAAVVVARQLGGHDAYVYAGNLLPAGVDPLDLEHLLELGMIEEVH